MSSNVGLSTPRGSGTSGYVQRNLSHLRPRDYPPPSSSSAIASNTREYRQRQPDKEILEHDRKRGVEVKCLEFRDKLEDERVDEDDIDERVETYRKKLLGELEREGEGWDVAGGGGKKGGFKPHQVHEIAVAKAAESERLRNALGISKDYQEGSHWKKQEDERQKRLGDREKEIAASRRRSASPS
ncbi:putative Pre-mRNA-splicing factor CWC21 [Tuber indicum]|nr:putative Pre-mRNA-splicing factor CWC21 [Tuber indicum]